MGPGQTNKPPGSQAGPYGQGVNAHAKGRGGPEVSLKSKFSLIQYLHGIVFLELI